MEFSVEADDRINWDKLDKADIVLLGVSCTAKTPLSLYLGYRGYKTSNLPLVPELSLDLDRLSLYQGKMVGLTIEQNHLKKSRKRKVNDLSLPINSKYSQAERIAEEIEYAKKVLVSLDIPVVDVTEKSIERLAIEVLKVVDL